MNAPQGKNRAFIWFFPHLLLAGLAMLGAQTAAFAERADRDKPLNLEADSLTYDDRNKVTTATGRVVATKGTIVMRAARVVVRQDANGQQHTTLTSDGKTQVLMRQKRDGLNEYIEGQANRIERDERTLIVKLSGNAKMRRFAGGTLADEVVGDTIVYNDRTEVYQVIGGASTKAGGAYSGPVPAGRVRVLIVPTQTPTPTAARAASAKASPAPAPVPPFTPTPAPISAIPAAAAHATAGTTAGTAASTTADAASATSSTLARSSVVLQPSSRIQGLP